MATTSTPYPWYGLVSGPELEQGDIFLEVPVFEIPPAAAAATGEALDVVVRRQKVIVMTQSCDLVQRADGNYDVDEVILCPVYYKSELALHKVYGKKDGWNEARKGRHPGYHVLNQCELAGYEFEYALVDLRRIYSLPHLLIKKQAASLGNRVRLLPPYREHLSQAFARFFMRVGLPSDIPPFK